MAYGDGKESQWLICSALFLTGGWSGQALTWHLQGHNWSLEAFWDTVQSFPAKVHVRQAGGSWRLCLRPWSPPRPRSPKPKPASLEQWMRKGATRPSVLRLPIPSSLFLAQPALHPKCPPCKGGKKVFSSYSCICFFSPQVVLTVEAVNGRDLQQPHHHPHH